MSDTVKVVCPNHKATIDSRNRPPRYSDPFVCHTCLGRDGTMMTTLDPVHPTVKPVPLLAKMIGWSTSVGEIVLDSFMGSGTTLRAAKDLQRRAIGIEIEERYCEIAAQRLSQQVFDFSAVADTTGETP